MQNRYIASQLVPSAAFLISGIFLLNSVNAQDSTFTTIINAPPVVIGDSERIDSNTQLNVSDGGQVGIFFQAGSPSDVSVSTNVEVNITGGVIGRNFSANRNSTVNISGGTIGSSFDAESGSRVNVSGTPTFGSFFTAGFDSDVNIASGSFNQITAITGSRLTIEGGDFGGFLARIDADVDISGGSFLSLTASDTADVNVSGGRFGTGFNVFNANNRTTLVGNEFRVNGSAIPDLSRVTLATGDSLTGTFQDGQAFLFTGNGSSETLRNVGLQRVDLPAASTTPVVFSSSADVVPSARAGTSIELQGSSQVGDFYAVIDGGNLTVAGGSAGVGLEAYDSTVNISEGTIGRGLSVLGGGVLNVSGGSIDRAAVVRDGTLRISDGEVGQGLVVFNTRVEISGGEIGPFFRLDSTSVPATISGGIIGERFEINQSDLDITGGSISRILDISGSSVVNISGGSIDGRGIEVFDDSTINLVVRDAFFDDVEITDLADDSSLLFTDREGILSGRFADGSDFSFNLTANRSSSAGNNFAFFADTASLTLRAVAVPEPSSLSCLVLFSFASIIRRRRKA